jgi:hypothetical protein
MNLTNTHSYGAFVVNNPSGSNRHVTINGTGVTYTFNDSFHVNAGELRLATNIIVGDGSGEFAIGSGGILKISNTNGANQFPGTFSTYSVDASSTVEYDGATGTAFVNCPDVAGWGNLTISGSGTTKTLQGSNNTVRGTLKLSSGILSATTLLTMASGSKIVRSGNDASGIMTVSGGATVGANDYTIEYTDTTKTTQSAELSGTGRKTLKINLNYGEVLSLHSDTTLGDSLIINEGSTLNTNAYTLYVGKSAGFFGGKSGTGRISLRGSGASIYGNGRGIVNALEINSVDSLIVEGDSLRVDTLILTAGKLNLGDKALALGSAATGNGIISVSSPGTSKMIQVTGSLSDAGVSRYYNGTGNFTWPIGVVGKYTPASINVSSTGLAGTITMRAVDDTALTKTNSPTYAPALVYYWNVTSSGFSSPQTTHTYTWVNADTLEATYSGTYAFKNFVPGRYESSSSSWFTENTSNVSLTGHTITFNGNGTFLNAIDGDYTMGQTNISGASDAFGSVTVFYSRASDDWNLATTWSNLGYGGVAASSAPGPNSPVKILAGDSITITGTNTRCASLMDSGVVNIQTFGGSTNFGTVTGTGKITMTSASLPGGNLTSFYGSSGGTFEYGGSGSYTLSTSLGTYRNLLFSGGGTKTMASIVYTLRGLVITGGTQVLMSTGASGNISVNGNITLEGTNDELRFQNGTARTVSCTDLTIGSGANFLVSASGTAVANSLSIAGNLTNNGTFDMSVSGSRYAAVTFTGASNATISGTTSDTTDFETLTVNKGSDTTYALDVNSSKFTISGSAGGSTKPLNLVRGTFKLTSQGTSPILDLSTGGGDFSIRGGTRLWIAGGSVQMSGSGDNVALKGQLKVSAGSFNVGTSTSVASSIFYDSTASVVEVIGTGVLRVSGALRPSAGTIFKYIQSGDSVIVGRYAVVAGGATFQVVNSASSLFQMTGGVLALRRANNNTALMDIGASATQTVTGGTIHLLDPNLSSANTFALVMTGAVSRLKVYNLSIGPCAGFTGSIALDDSLEVKGNFTQNIASGTFRTSYANGGNANRDMYIAGNFTRTAGTFNTAAGTATGTTTMFFNGTSGKQTITGTSTFNSVNIYNQSSPSDTVMLASGTDLTVAGNWTMSAGKFDAITNKQLVTFASTTVAQTITGSSTFNNLTLNNTFGNVTLASGTLTIDSVLTMTGGILALGANSLVLNETNVPAIEGAFSSTRMIQTGGASGDLGVTKAFPAGTHGFRFPVGTGANYTPATIRVTDAGTTPAAGTITVNPVNAAHPNLSDGSLALPYYWKVQKTGLASDARVQNYFVYGTGITPLGTEASYVGGYYNPFTWTNPTSSVDATGDSITIFNPDSTIIAADYTAGEPTSFGQPTVYYSKASGNWNTVGTWGIGSYTGTNGTPSSTDPVVIGNGKTVTIQNGLSARTVVGVTFDQYGGSTPGPGTLLIQNTATNDLGTISGVGTIILDNSSGTPALPTGTYTNFVAKDSGTVIFAGSASYTIPTQTTTFNDVVFANNTTKTIGSSITVNGTMRVLGGQVNMGTFTANHNGGVGDSLALASGVVLRVSGASNFPSSYNVYDFNSTSKVLYDFAGTTTVSALNGYSYGRLQFIATATRVRTLAGDINVRDSLILGNFNNLYTSTNNYNITLGGHVVLGQAANSLLTLGTNTVTFNGSSAQQVKRIANANGTANFYNLTINNSSGVSFVYSGASTTFNQNDTVRNTLIINAGNNLTLGRGNTWVFGGSIAYPSQTGTITSSDSTNLTMNGTTVYDTLRFASGAVPRSFRNFTINRTATGAQVVVTGTNDSLQLTGTLTLTKGIIRMGNNKMRLMNSAITPISGGDSTSYVDGKMTIAFPASTSNVGRNFEIGNGNFYRPVRVTGSTQASRTHVFTEILPRAATIDSRPSEVNAVSNVRYYRVSIDSGLVFNAGTDTVRLSFRTNNYDAEGVNDPDSLRVMRSSDSLNWTMLTGGGYHAPSAPAGRDSGGNASILLTNTSNAGTYYVIASIASDNTLPVLLSGKFRAIQLDGRVRLEWRTESELENAYWVIERREVTGDLSKLQAFQSLMTIEGQGTKSSATDYAEIDNNVEVGKTYEYRLADVSLSGVKSYHNEVTVTVLPGTFKLEPNYPNPFNPETTIRFYLPTPSNVTLKVYNILGQEVVTLFDRSLQSGPQSVVWRGVNKYNQSVASGIYIYRMTAVSADGKEKFTQTRKMVLLK